MWFLIISLILFPISASLSLWGSLLDVLKHSEKRYLGNFNATCIDSCFQKQIRDYGLGQIYITDMVKTEGGAGSDFKKEWESNRRFKECLLDEIEIVKPKFIVCISGKTDELFRQEFEKELPDIKILEKIYHPSYVFRWSKVDEWNDQFRKLLAEIGL